MDSFQLPDGTKISVTTGKQVRDSFINVPTNTEAQTALMNTKRKLVDLPDIPQKMNAISVVVAYTLVGLGNDEISLALGIPLERVAAIKMLDAFGEMLEMVSQGVMTQDVDPVTNLLNNAALGAASSVIALAENADEEKTRLAASKDILDRAGHRPADVREHRISMDGGMVVEHVTRSEHAELENISDAIDVEVIE